MKEYDYKQIKRFVQMHSDIIESVYLGMSEDWFWTSECIYENNHFLLNLEDCPEIAGIWGSSWATPSMLIHYKDSSEKMIPCFVGESTDEKPAGFQLGVLSQPWQEYIEDLTSPKKLN